jgi:hypothetical protein
MRLGCLGCLGVIVGLLLLGGLVAGALWVWTGIQSTPPMLSASVAKADPAAVERKLAEIGLRASGRSTRSEPLVLGEPEVAALVSTHLADAGLVLSPVTVRLRPGQASLQGRLPVAAFIEGSPVAWAAPALPRSTLSSPVWITLAGHLELEHPAGPRRPRYAQVALLTTRIGRIPMPIWLLSLMLGPRGASLLRWQVPGVIDHLEVGEGRLTLRTR